MVSWTPASAVFWGGVALMTWASWAVSRRPELVLRLVSLPSGSVADQAERWLRDRPVA